jgi:hypothetical protein
MSKNIKVLRAYTHAFKAGPEMPPGCFIDLPAGFDGPVKDEVADAAIAAGAAELSGQKAKV